MTVNITNGWATRILACAAITGALMLAPASLAAQGAFAEPRDAAGSSESHGGFGGYDHGGDYGHASYPDNGYARGPLGYHDYGYDSQGLGWGRNSHGDSDSGSNRKVDQQSHTGGSRSDNRLGGETDWCTGPLGINPCSTLTSHGH
ncbi:hypothetical protein [Nocardia panacis]|nr:hypothetical protein [Nocardia panacis]